jgi:hypothetical protein
MGVNPWFTATVGVFFLETYVLRFFTTKINQAINQKRN